MTVEYVAVGERRHVSDLDGTASRTSNGSVQTGDGLDTALARLLYEERSVSLRVLQACLEEVRRRRAQEPIGLADLLVERGWLSPADAEAASARIKLDPTVLERSSAAPGAVATPKQLGPYRLVRELARGGMGAVHEAVHEETGARCAVKTLLPWLLAGDDLAEDRARFAREVEALALLRHPNVVGIHAAEVDGPTPYLVQDLLTGGSLWARIQAGPVPIAEAVEITVALAEGLAHCHERGILHRDLKPQNVLLDERGSPQLADFGLAHLGGAQRLTQTGDVLGTPGYMAPEQARGDAVFDERTDVYGLGGILYALLTGRPPFRGSNLFAVLNKVIAEPPAPPRAERAEVPDWLEAVCLRALAKRPADRFASALELGQALRAARAPTSRRPVWPLIAAAGLIVATAVVARFGGGSSQAPSKPEASPSPTTAAASPAPTSPSSARSRPFGEARFQVGARAVLGVLERNRLTVLSGGGDVLLFDPGTSSPRHRFAFAPGTARSLRPRALRSTRWGWLACIREGKPALIQDRQARSLDLRAITVTHLGRRLAVATKNKGVAIYRLPDLRRTHTLPLTIAGRGLKPIRDLVFLDPQTLVVARGGHLEVWGLEDGKPLQEGINLETFNPSRLAVRGNVLAAGSRKGRLMVFRHANRRLHVGPSLQGTASMARQHHGEVCGVALSSTGETLYSAGSRPLKPNVVRAWDTATGAPLGELRRKPELHSLTLSDDDRHLIVGTRTGMIEVIATERLHPPRTPLRWLEDALKRTIELPRAQKVSATLRSDRLTAMTGEGVVFTVDPSSVNQPKPVNAFQPPLRNEDAWPLVPFETAQGWIVGVRGNDPHHLMRHRGGQPKKTAIRTTAVAVQGDRVAVVGRQHGVWVVKLLGLNMEKIGVRDLPGIALTDVAFLPDGRLLVSGEKRLVVWDPASKTNEAVETIIPRKPIQLAVANGVVAIGTTFGEIVSYTLQGSTLKPRDVAFRIPDAYAGSIRGLVFSPDGATLFALGSPRAKAGNLAAFDIRTGKLLGLVKVPSRAISLDLDPTGRVLVTGSTTGKVTLVSVPKLLRSKR